MGVQGGAISLHGSQVSRTTVLGQSGLADFGSFTLHVTFLTKIQNPQEADGQVSCLPSSGESSRSLEQCRGCQGTPGSLGEAILGTGYQGRNRNRSRGCQEVQVSPFPPRAFCTLLTASSHRLSFLPPSQAGPRWSPIKGLTNLGR